MKLIVGLGNPGEKYARTRHNAGFMVVDALANDDDFVSRVGSMVWQTSAKFCGMVATGRQVILLKPTTFMNVSGKSVGAVAWFYKIKTEDIYVIHDDLDIAVGNYKIQHAKGPRIHYGVNSIEEVLGTEDFWRVRVGVENRAIKGNSGVSGEVYSLQNFSDKERTMIDTVTRQIVAELLPVVS